MTLSAARRSALLSLLFLAVYGASNWFAAQQTDVGVWYFAWERHIPFVPAMIVPYLSLDIFFVAAPFLCRNRQELRVFTERVTMAILVAGLCFVCFPLRFAFERPEAAGWSGALLNAFVSLDRPFNLFPSLHIVLGLLLADVYWRHTTGVLRVLCAAWFVSIGLSTIFIYQHHLVDVAGGLALGALVLYGVRPSHARHRAARNSRVGAYYVVGSAAAVAGAIILWPWGAWLLWPALSLVLVGAAYLGAGPSVFRKSNGTIPLSARIVLWPCLAGQWLSLQYYRRRCRPYDRVAPGVWIGRRLDDREAAQAVARGVTAVLDVSAELSEPRAFTRVAYKNIQVVDLTAPTPAQLDDAVRFITAHAGEGIVYVHCKIGYSRSAAAVGAYLLAAGLARTTREAIAMLRVARPSIVVRPEAIAALRQFEARPRGRARRPPRSVPAAVVAALLAAVARIVCGTSSRWLGCEPSLRQRIYFANHTSHADFVVLWASLPADVRAHTRPVAGRDYWDRSSVRRYLARQVFRAVLVDRREPAAHADGAPSLADARRSVQCAARALATGASLIIFPEGTRGDGSNVRPFKSGLYHLCRLRPDVELVPVRLENMHRILPKGEALPVPITGSVTFGRPMRLEPGEDKHAFLARAQRALLREERPCTSLPIPILRAS